MNPQPDPAEEAWREACYLADFPPPPGARSAKAIARIGRTLTWVSRAIGVWAMTYGILIAIQGDPSWGPHAYDVLHKIPGAPESLGVAVALSGFGLFVLEPMRPRLAGLCAAVIALVAATIGVGFLLAEILVPGVTPIGQPGAVTYGLFIAPLVALRAYGLIRDGV